LVHCGGAFLNSHRIQVSPATRFDVNSFLTVYTYAQRDYVLEALPSKPRIYGSAAYDFCLVARGTALMCFEPKAKVWDVTAGWLLVEEAGGVVRHYDDEVVFPLSPGDYAARPLAVLSAANEALWQEARARVLPRTR
jgi:fructose-1,6-bisphosphatase/inositol monophosphatase family enzyme